MNIHNELELLVSDRHGIYIPQVFMEHYGDDWENISDENKEILKDVDNEEYWEAWEEVLNHATHPTHSLCQDGDLWAVSSDMKNIQALRDEVMRKAEEETETGISKDVAKNINELIFQANGSLYGTYPMSFHTDAISAWFNNLDLPSYVWYDEGFGELDMKEFKIDIFGKELAQYIN